MTLKSVTPTRMVASLKLFLLLLLLPMTALATPLSNQLKNHPSPYLALHGNDPVIWQDWSQSVVDTARRDNKLIFVSSGYFSCHWCHVMQKESYSDQQVAEKLNQLAVPVKVDRELQPALDAWLIDFTERTAGQAGWPLNVFLTPDGYPLVGMTYMPKENFLSVVEQLQNKWQTEEADLRKIAMNAFAMMKPEQQSYSTTSAKPGMDKTLVELQIRQAMSQIDDISGGFGDQNKFPMSPLLLSLLESQRHYPDESLAAFLKLTLDQMAHLGLRDHIGGGFYRYTVDPAWDIPHFEKMLYDNAMLAKVYLLGADILQQAEYLEVAYDTLDFTLREMRADNGGFYASLSAVDDKDIEGGYYLWQVDELKQLLSPEELEVVGTGWGARGAPYLEAGHHIKQLKSVQDIAARLKISPSEVARHLSSAKQKLFHARQQRKLPVDHKVLAAWNGLMLESLSLAAAKNPEYREAAGKLYSLLSQTMWDGKQLHRFLHEGQPGGQVSLEDYAYVAAGIAAWAEVSGDKDAWHYAENISHAAMQRFHNQHGWQPSENMVIPYDARELILAESTMPSPSATLLQTRLKIAQYKNDKKQIDQISHYLDIENSGLITAPLWYGSHINLLSQLLSTP